MNHDQYSRRDWIKIAGLVAASGAVGVSGSRFARAADAEKLRITTAGYEYDRVEALTEQPRGIASNLFLRKLELEGPVGIAHTRLRSA